MVKKYQETANFVSGVLDVTELQNISPFMSKPQKFSIQRVLVLSDADYRAIHSTEKAAATASP